mgnify:CR=1
MPTIDELRKKAAMEALGETLSGAAEDIDIREFVKEDLEGQALLEENAKRRATIGRAVTAQDAFWASGTFSPCIRRDWLQMKGARPTDDGANYDIFGLGNDIEGRIIEKFIASGQYIRGQERIIIRDPRLRIPIVGKADLLIYSRTDLDPMVGHDNEMMVVEVKSTGDFGIERGANLWKKFLPKPEHVAQATLYMKALNLKFAYLVYFNRQRAISTRFLIKWNQEFYETIIEHFQKTEKSLDGPEPAIPKGLNGRSYPCIWFSRAPDEKGKPTGMCSWFSHCFAEHDVVFPEEVK